jgi:hypothetical protein
MNGKQIKVLPKYEPFYNGWNLLFMPKNSNQLLIIFYGLSLST